MGKVIYLGRLAKRDKDLKTITEKGFLIIDLSAIQNPIDLDIPIKEGLIEKIHCSGQPKMHLWMSIAKLVMNCEDHGVKITFEEGIEF